MIPIFLPSAFLSFIIALFFCIASCFRYAFLNYSKALAWSSNCYAERSKGFINIFWIYSLSAYKSLGPWVFLVILLLSFIQLSFITEFVFVDWLRPSSSSYFLNAIGLSFTTLLNKSSSSLEGFPPSTTSFPPPSLPACWLLLLLINESKSVI